MRVSAQNISLSLESSSSRHSPVRVKSALTLTLVGEEGLMDIGAEENDALHENYLETRITISLSMLLQQRGIMRC